MIAQWKRVATATVVVLSLVAAGSSAAGPHTALYELTENMALFCADGEPFIPGVYEPCPVPARRVATAQLQGYAALGTTLCQSSVLVTNPKAQICTITATGSDDVAVVLVVDPSTGAVTLAAGAGTVGGTYAVVVQGDNAVDSPEFVVQTGGFSGDIDLSPTQAGIPLGTITNGTFTIDQAPGVVLPFTGTFRLPFAMSAAGKRVKPLRGKDAFYLGDNGLPIPVRQNERALGFPTVRFEVNFQ